MTLVTSVIKNLSKSHTRCMVVKLRVNRSHWRSLEMYTAENGGYDILLVYCSILSRTVNDIAASLFSDLYDLYLLRTATFQMLVVALVHLLLDYGNAVVGIPTYLVRRLQSVLNAAARLIYHLRPHDHITDALATVTLHWLRVLERVQYKIAVLTFKVLHDSAPRYLGPLVAVADLPGRRALWSASTSRLVIPPIKLSAVGSRAFPVAVAQVWNGLPEAFISLSSLQTFRRRLKTYPFQLSYLHLIL